MNFEMSYMTLFLRDRNSICMWRAKKQFVPNQQSIMMEFVLFETDYFVVIIIYYYRFGLKCCWLTLTQLWCHFGVVLVQF